MQVGVVFKAAVTTVLLFFLIILIIVASPIYLFRWLVSKLGRCRHAFGKILSPHSAIFYIPNIHSCPSLNVGIGLEVAGSMNSDRIVDLLSSRMIFLKNPNGKLVHPEFQQFPVTRFGFPYWKWETKFEIRDHIHFYPKTSDPISNVHAFRKSMEFLGKGLRQNKSPWEVMVVEKESSYLFFFKFHHSLADGYAIFNALIKCCDVPATLIRPVSEKLTLQKKIQKCLRLIKFLFLMTHTTTHVLGNELPTETFWDILPSKMTSERFYGVTSLISIAAAKELSKRSGISLSSVILSCIAGAVRKYMGKEWDHKGSGLLTNIPLPAPRHPEGLTNYLAGVDIELPLVEAAAETHAQEIQILLKEKLTEMAPEKHSAFCTLIGGLPRWFTALLPLQFPPLCVSVFPGPKERVTFDVFPVVDMYFTLNVSHYYSCMVTVCSYDAYFRILINMDGNVCKSQEDVERMTKLVEEEICGLEVTTE